MEDISFFNQDLDCSPLTLNCNFVIIRRNDGTGNMDISHSLWSYLEQSMNDNLTNITDQAMCSTGYPLDSKVRVKFEVHHIDNTDAWDWYGKANEDGLPSDQWPNDYLCPKNIPNSWPALNAEINTFKEIYFGDINFFFVDNGELVDLLETHIANGTEPSEAFIDRFRQYKIDNPDCEDCGVVDGCSSMPNPYESTLNENSIIMVDTYSDYLIRNNFHHIWYPEHANETSETVWGWSLNSKPLLFLHELGHSILNFGHSETCNQLMNFNDPNYTNHIPLTGLNRLHKVIASTDLHNAVDCNSLSDVCPVVVEADDVIFRPISIFGDLIVKEGVTLRIATEVYFSEESRIIVEPNAKLLVDNGAVLTSKCGSTWKGIKVYGGNSDYDVKLTDDAVIENTSEAAVSMFAPESWPEITAYGNGILKADNVTFNNTKRIVEFMAWSSNSPNPSYIRDCTQNGGKWSITNWNCQGIEVSENVFNNITEDCIVTETGSFTIIDNEFHSERNDILFNNISATQHTRVELNDFYGAFTGYNARGTTISQNEIHDNNFHSGENGIFNDGHNQYKADANTFANTFGSLSFNNGGGLADVHNNEFMGNLVGTIPSGINEDYNFYENCYSTTYFDNYILGQVATVIHSDGEAANNCFTHGGNTNSVIDDIGGNPDGFTYLEPVGDLVDCRDAILANVNVILDQEGNPQLPECGSSFLGGPGTTTTFRNYCYPNRVVKTDVLSALSWLLNKLSEIEENPNLTTKQKERFKSIYLKCFRRVRGYLFEILIKEEKFNDARNLFLNESHEDAIVYIFSTYIMENDLTSARAYINSINALEEQMVDFVIIQNINLDRLPYGPFYEASIDEINVARDIALKSHPYAAYGKSLYYILTGEVISSELPQLFRNETAPRNSSKDESGLETKVYPNPFVGNLNVETKGYEKVEITISDLFGRLVYNNSISTNNLIITTDSWKQGIYLISIRNNGELVYTDKVISIQ